MTDELWAGEFGNEYNARNANDKLIDNNEAMFLKMGIDEISTALELGCGYGYSLLALKRLFPALVTVGIEINAQAAKEAEKNGITTIQESIRNYQDSTKYDFVLTKGMLMYITEEEIENAYKLLYNSSSKYICICEYYNPSTTTINHRGGTLYKRDYGKIQELYPDLELVNYGFIYHKDKYPQDDITWFLFKKL